MCVEEAPHKLRIVSIETLAFKTFLHSCSSAVVGGGSIVPPAEPPRKRDALVAPGGETRQSRGEHLNLFKTQFPTTDELNA